MHIGEQNITENHTGINEDGKVQHIVTVNDGNYAPYCTQEALKDHLGEFASAKDGQFVVKVDFDKPCNDTNENNRGKRIQKSRIFFSLYVCGKKEKYGV